MAKTNTVQIKLVSSADTGFFYVTKKNARTQTGKLELKKYDPVVRKHVAVQGSQDQVTCGTGSQPPAATGPAIARPGSGPPRLAA